MQTAAEAGEGPRPSVAKSPSQRADEPPSHSTLSTAGRLKYADPRSLPSFPSPGLSPGGAAASAAASLGWYSHKPVETWKPDKTSSASAAAVLARDYKISPAWEPTMDGTGTKAAVLAVGSASAAYRQSSVRKTSQGSLGSSAATQAFSTNTSRPAALEPVTLTTSHGSSAATQAFHASRIQSAKVASSPPASPREKPLVAAKGAMSPSKHGAPRPRLRSYSSPQESHYSDAAKASASALNGASIAHRAAMNRTHVVEDAGAVPITTMTRNMFTSHPPVKPEVDEQTNNERIHQSAVEMAKKMYRQQQSRHDDSQDGHDAGIGDASATHYADLQDAAYRQAQERLAKLQDEHEKNRRYHEYYGAGKPLRRRFTIINKLRRRSASDSDMEDRARSEMIHQQMPSFSPKLDQVDEEKRERDREALLAVARRNVKASLQGMDEKVYFETGKVNSTILGDWQVRAQQAARLRHDTRAEGDDGRVDIGGGMFMDADEIDAIAARRVRPVLDDIHEKAEAERERLALARMEEEEQKAEVEREKARDRELRDLQKRAKEEDKQQEKAKRQQEKQEEKQRREEEKSAKAEQKKLAKEEKSKSKAETASDSRGRDSRGEGDEEQEAETQSRQDSNVPQGTTSPTQGTAADKAESSQGKSSEGTTSPTARVKGWIRNRFSRGKSMSEAGEKKKSFVGGAALRDSGPGGSTGSLENRPSSVRDVTLAGRSGEETAGNRAETPLDRDSRGVSPVSTGSGRSSEFESFETPRAMMDQTPRQGNSPMRDSRFKEMMDH
ncbi:hypothetical protein Trco_005486 [Trichoderma cornu-damae]|uniref:Eisosome protein 1 n=1 Tax=Trichoderma cornu-damae TaxID=654480 RepID=A0A9P8QNJ7_9HYPO|nr:hypothetical protein Trco_005486 [Trichoderma cornu-damae]